MSSMWRGKLSDTASPGHAVIRAIRGGSLVNDFPPLDIVQVLAFFERGRVRALL